MNSKLKTFVMLSSLVLCPIISVMPQNNHFGGGGGAGKVSIQDLRVIQDSATAKVTRLQSKLSVLKALQSNNVRITSLSTGGSGGKDHKGGNLKASNKSEQDSVSAQISRLQSQLTVAKIAKAEADKALLQVKQLLNIPDEARK